MTRIQERHADTWNTPIQHDANTAFDEARPTVIATVLQEIGSAWYFDCGDVERDAQPARYRIFRGLQSRILGISRCVRQGAVEAPTLWVKLGEGPALVSGKSWKERGIGPWLGGQGHRDYQLCSVFWGENFGIMSDSRANWETMMKVFVCISRWVGTGAKE